MKTFFIEIVLNNVNKKFKGNKFLRAIISAKDNDEAGEIALKYYQPHYTGGDTGEFYIQCNWEVHIPTREIIEKLWENASKSEGSIPVTAGESMETIGYRKFQLDETKKDVLDNWDYCNCSWADPVVYYEPKKGGYVVALHNYMSTPFEFYFFKGVTKEIYDKAMKWVEDNTFHGDYYKPFL